ncbi:MAG: transglutaminase [Streptosporangiales bacterium]|nr:transglutaminase [Streptosporangiales bacterium]
MRLSAGALIATVCAALLLHPLFESGGWFVPAALAAAATIGGAALGRRLSVPGWAEPLPALLALLVFMTVTFTSDEAILALIPTPESVTRLGVLLEAGWYDVNRYAAPVPPYLGITTVTTLGVGAVALAVEFLAVRMRRAALAGLPLLALFSVPVAVLRDQLSWPLFALAAAGFLVLLAFDGRERVGRWGRPVTVRAEGATPRRNEPAVDTSAFAGMGRRLGLTAVLVALVVPAVIPGIRDDGLFGVGGGGGPGDGGGTSITTPNPIVSLKRQLNLPRDAEVMRYRTGMQVPGYLRMNVLDAFDGQAWTMSTVRGGRDDRVAGRPLPEPQGLRIAAPQASVEAQISERVTGMNFLPLPYPTREIDIRGDWLVHGPTLMVFSTRSEAGGSTYRAQVLDVRPSREQLRGAGWRAGAQGAGRYLNVPRVDQRIQRLATEITEGATSPYERAVALQEWFTTGGRFRYDLTVPGGNGTSALSDFLLRTRAGYCEQFAASMALMARMTGIPARVAVGYTSGTRTADGSWSVSTRDAHAWPELFFDGIGWVRFEPTPSGLAGQGSASVPDWSIPPPPTPGTGAGGPSPEAIDPESETSPESTATAAPGGPERPDPGAGADVGGTVGPIEDEGPGRWLGWTALVIVALLCWPRLQRSAVRRWRWARARGDAELARAAWRELRDDVVDMGGEWRGAESPRGAARRLVERYHLDGSAAEALWRIALAEERARYAPAPAPAPALAADVAQVRRAARAAVRPHRRLRAILFPRSSLDFLGLTLGRGYDTLEHATTLPTTWRNRLRRHPT